MAKKLLVMFVLIALTFAGSAWAITGDVYHDDAVTLADAITALQVVAGMPDLTVNTADDVYVTSEKVIGLPEAIFALQMASELRVPAGGDRFTNSLSMEFVRIPTGTFMMGSPTDEPGRYPEEPQHQVTLTNDFYMMTTEVTQAQWEAVMGSNPSYFDTCGGNCPVETVSWNDIQEFITAFNAMEGKTYRLPTEAEWEYAARAGTTTAFYNGGITNTSCTPLDPNLDQIGWYCGNADWTTHPVEQKQPNDWGLHDMSGNVHEWVQDWYGSYPDGAVVDPTGPDTGSYRVLRGGSWDGDAGACRSAFRSFGTPSYRLANRGFRLALSPGQSPFISAPTGVTATAGNGQVTLEWGAVDGATAYHVYGADFSGVTVGNSTILKPNASSPLLVSPLNNRTEYFFIVTAENAMGESEPSTEVSATPTETTVGDMVTDNSGLGMTFVRIPAGTFMMGSPTDELLRLSNETQHQVTLTQDFYMMTTEVTQAQWEAVMGTNPSYFTACGGKCPVESVSWNDIQEFIVAFNAMEGKTYRLPTEAEWEYAARAGSTTAFYNGGISNTGCTDPNLDQIGWYCGNADSTTHPVEQKQPNDWGLHDMSGNVYEWVQDWYGSYPDGAVVDPTGRDTGAYRVLRGGSWRNSAVYPRSAYRGSSTPSSRRYGRGFRLALSPGQSPSISAPTGVTATAGNGQVTLEWGAVDGATAYHVYGADFSGVTVGNATILKPNASSPLVVSPLNNGTEYFFIVTAENAMGESEPSTEVSATPTETTVGDMVTDSSGLGMTFVRIPAGTFMMGSPTDELGRDSNETQHQVTLTQDFYMMTTEVTQAQWEAVMGTNPSYFTACGGKCPVESVSWNDIQEFIVAFNAMEGKTYRLPTEAEWEYAARAGSTTAFYYGGIYYTRCTPLDPYLDQIGWYCGNADSTTHPVEQKQPNDWGLHDMSGNVSEWVQDWYGSYPDGAVVDPTGPDTGSDPVLRGGAWNNPAWYCRSASRRSSTPSHRYGYVGFRLALSPGQSPSISAPTGVTATAGNGQVTLEWGAVDGATAYHVYGADFSGVTVGNSTILKPNASSPLVVSPLNNGTEYFFIVTAENAMGESEPSTEVSATPTETTGGDTITDNSGLDMTFVRIPAGTFMMGSEDGDSDESPQHQVTLTQDFYMMTTEVTQAQWEAVMGTNPSYFTACGGKCPVESVSWNDIQEFIVAFNAMEGKTYRLPTEAEWEYAARAGSTTAFYNGGITNTGCTPLDPNLDQIGWYCGNDDVDGSSTTHPVERKQPNDWGLHDMSGNVWEWCQDWYGSYPDGAVTDPTGTDTGSYRVLRGGSWFSFARYCRSANRGYDTPSDRYYYAGFRLALSPGQSPSISAPTGVTATAGNGQVTLEWGAVDGATAYHVYGADFSGVTVGNSTILKPNASSPLVVSPLNNGTEYFFIVTAENAMGESEPSTEVSATPTETTGGDTVTDGSGLDMTFVRIPAVGQMFYMGSPYTDPDALDREFPRHPVTFSQDFYIMTTEVTQAQWEAVMGTNPSYFTACGGKCPVEGVSWNDIQEFIVAFNAMEGKTYRLPTEAEWEYAARAGSTTAFYNGGMIANTGCTPLDPNLDQIGWYCGNADSTTHPVEQKQPNDWGLHDMSGNVYEWVQDWFGSYPDGAVVDPTGPDTGSYRVLRGGSWYINAGFCRSAARNAYTPSNPFSDYGFRLALSPGQSPSISAPTGVTATAGNGQVTLEWGAVDGATAYHVYGADFSGVTVGNSTILKPNASSPLVVSPLNNRTEYFFIVTAENAMGESEPSTEVSATPTETTVGDTVTDAFGLGMTFVRIPAAGQMFYMGSPYTDPDALDREFPRHPVTFSQDFYIMTTEVTQAQWEAVMGSNPSSFNTCGRECPVETVSWDDIQDFIAAFIAMGGKTYRLPTEAEWEYAARAGTQTLFAFGDCLGTDQANYDGSYPLPGCPAGEFSTGTIEVGTLGKNAWNLYDMHGNVWEWVEDQYHSSYDGAPTDGSAWVDFSEGSNRVLRGGSWNNRARDCRSAYRDDSAYRDYGIPSLRLNSRGFRLALSPGQ